MIVQGQEVVEWVAEKAGIKFPVGMTGIGYYVDDSLIAGACFERWTGKSVTVHQRVDKPAPRGFWFACADYMFNHLNCTHCIGAVDSLNEKAIKINLKMGFEIKTTIKDAGSDGNDLLIMVMTKENCRLLKWGKNV